MSVAITKLKELHNCYEISKTMVTKCYENVSRNHVLHNKFYILFETFSVFLKW